MIKAEVKQRAFKNHFILLSLCFVLFGCYQYRVEFDPFYLQQEEIKVEDTINSSALIYMSFEESLVKYVSDRETETTYRIMLGEILKETALVYFNKLFKRGVRFSYYQNKTQSDWGIHPKIIDSRYRSIPGGPFGNCVETDIALSVSIFHQSRLVLNKIYKDSFKKCGMGRLVYDEISHKIVLQVVQKIGTDLLEAARQSDNS